MEEQEEKPKHKKHGDREDSYTSDEAMFFDDVVNLEAWSI